MKWTHGRLVLIVMIGTCFAAAGVGWFIEENPDAWSRWTHSAPPRAQVVVPDTPALSIRWLELNISIPSPGGGPPQAIAQLGMRSDGVIVWRQAP